MADRQHSRRIIQADRWPAWVDPAVGMSVLLQEELLEAVRDARNIGKGTRDLV